MAIGLKILLHLPLLAEDKNVPYVFVRSKQALGRHVVYQDLLLLVLSHQMMMVVFWKNKSSISRMLLICYCLFCHIHWHLEGTASPQLVTQRIHRRYPSKVGKSDKILRRWISRVISCQVKSLKILVSSLLCHI